ncbi:MAG TPA: transaldolase family protein [Pirellulaceae bacterium]|jgi:transaldolase|nr:transaldolase family protein [Pirellulaceae bacterium]
MADSIQSLLATGTKLWLDSVDPELVLLNRDRGATGATSNPIIISGLLETGRFDERMGAIARKIDDDGDLAWQMTDEFVTSAQKVFRPVWEKTRGDDGYVSFEIDPLLEDLETPVALDDKVAQYVELGRRWAEGHDNRMIKVPATEAGLASLEELAAAGISLNVTLIFSDRQYEAARDAIWRGAQRRKSLDKFKSVYSIFVSRIDVYTEKAVPSLSSAAQGQVGIVNAKRIWAMNEKFWSDKKLPLKQEMIFASTGVKKKEDPAEKYVAALAGSDIQTNPPETNEAIANKSIVFTRQVDKMPPQNVLDEIDAKVDFAQMERVLMEEGLRKFADPQTKLLKTIAGKREQLVS